MVQSIEDARRRSAASPRSAPGRVPPHNLQAEQSLLGAMLLSRDAIASAVEACGTDDFYKPAHSHIFDAITALYSQGEPADPVTVADELSRAGLLEAVGGLSTLISLQADTPATANAGRYATIVEEHALLRRLIGVAGEIAELGYSVPDDVEAVVDQAETLVFEVAERRTTDTLKPLNKLLEDSLDRLEALYERGEAVTGVPTGYVDLDERLSGLQKSALIIVGARPAMGKCVAWDTRLADPATGAVHTVAELYRRHAPGAGGGAAGRACEVVTLDDGQRLRTTDVAAWVDDGIKPVFQVRTRSGRSIRTTASHPFLTRSGWRPLADVPVGTCVAVPARLPVAGRDRLPEAELTLLAYLLGDGACWGVRPRLTTASALIAADAARSAGALGMRLVATAPSTPAVVAGEPGACGAPTAYDIAGPTGGPHPLAGLLSRHGLWACALAERRVPDAVFRLVPEQVALFLNRLFASGARLVSSDGRGAADRIVLTTGARRLARDVQHLLLRFGVAARLRACSVAAPSGRTPAWQVEVAGAGIETFCAAIGVFSEVEGCAALRTRVAASRASRRPTLPASRPRVLVGAGSPGAGILTAAPAARPVHASDGHRPRATGRPAFPWDPPMPAGSETEAGGPDVLWDEIVSITPDGEDQVYDLTVPGTHNFVADDMVVHNTAFALGIAAHAAMEAREPVLVFSLEMSHAEITQRLLVAEARVDANRIRNGRLQDSDWPKISNAIGRLGEAPLFIDDNPNLTVMELRAKARRLKAKQGGLGLIIVDYLQLMSGRRNSENRQVEISEISRGLKILARELEVPVIALSQLSRNLEMRADKRPVLADLRESGSLEQDADVVMFIYRDEVYNPESPDRGTAEIIVSKHRNGPTGKAQLAFLDHYTRFANMARM